MGNNRNRILLFFPFLLTCSLLSGCWDTNESERMVYVQGLGVDYNGYQYTIYIQIINTSLTAKSEARGDITETKVVVGHASGKTLNEAAFNLYASIQRRLFWGHLSFIVFSEQALKNGDLRATIDRFDRYRETRYSLNLYATKEPLSKVLKSYPPLSMTTALSRLGDPKASYEQRSFIRPLDMREFLIALNEPPHEAIIPYIRLTKNTWETETTVSPLIEFAGVAALTKNRLKEVMPFKNVKGLRWMNKDFKREEISLTKELSNISLIAWKIKLKKKPIVKDGNIQFQLSLDVTTSLSEMVSPERLAKIEQEAEKLIAAEIKDTYLEGLEHQIDIYRLSEVVYRKKVKAWKRVEQHGKIPLTKDSLQKITVKVKLLQGEKQKMRPTI
ncbi:Ger(x)C family spore germination protein [Neobacillus kokaensis]|uniref:Germination protein n=1 Tax=Neobacillus kokaensis TaxID=2759023 RepID=A0ABQ3NBH2_9BACI|nr:Ger(x)C family spore germination protein [Neobacillus kokaensis]GHI01249.1 germination protein [Neobacillus kokaensis]